MGFLFKKEGCRLLVGCRSAGEQYNGMPIRSDALPGDAATKFSRLPEIETA